MDSLVAGADRETSAESAARHRFAAEDVAWVSWIAAALALAAAFVWLAPTLAELYPSPRREVFSAWQVLIKPEPLEQARSILALAAPFVLAAAVIALGARVAPRRSLDPAIVAAQLVAVGLLTWAVTSQERVAALVRPDYFEPLLISVPNLVAGTLLGLALTAVAVADARWPRWMVGARERLATRGWVAAAIALAATVVWILPAVVTDATAADSGLIPGGHIPVYSEDYFAAVNGLTPLVDYIAQYASLLPLALAPVLAAFDSSLTAYSIAMCVLSGTALLAVYGSFRETTGGPWVALALYVPFLAISLFPWDDQGAVREFNGNYYGVLPGRLFGPFVLAWLCALALRRGRPRPWLLFLAAGLITLNNAEFGIAATVALAIALGLGWGPSLSLRQRLLRLLPQAAGGLTVALAIVSAITLARAGELPDLGLLTHFNRLFLRESYGLEPMPALGLHWALYATYGAALLTAAVRYARGAEERTLTGMLAFAGAFGLVTGMYFVGRSVQFQLMLLFPAWGFALALVAWTAWHSLRSARGDWPRLRRLLVPAAAALVGFGVMISAVDRLPPPWQQVERLSTGGEGDFDSREAQRFVAAQTTSDERVFLIGTPIDHRVAERAGVVNVSPVNGVVGLVSPVEAEMGLDSLEAEGGNKVFELVAASEPDSDYPFAVPEFGTILRRRGYEHRAVDPASGLNLWVRPPGAG